MFASGPKFIVAMKEAGAFEDSGEANVDAMAPYGESEEAEAALSTIPDISIHHFTYGVPIPGLTVCARARLCRAMKVSVSFPVLAVPPEKGWSGKELSCWMGFVINRHTSGPFSDLPDWLTIQSCGYAHNCGRRVTLVELAEKFNAALDSVIVDLDCIGLLEWASERIPLLQQVDLFAENKRHGQIKLLILGRHDVVPDPAVTKKAFHVELRASPEPERLANTLFDYVLGSDADPLTINSKLPSDFDRFLANVLYIGQSSGGGKSRLALASKECTRGRVLTLYINCRPAHTPSWPAPSPADVEFTRLILSINRADVMRVLYARVLFKMRDELTDLKHAEGCSREAGCYRKGQCFFTVRQKHIDKPLTFETLSIDTRFIDGEVDRYEEIFAHKNWVEQLDFLKCIRYSTRPVLFSICHDEAGILADNNRLIDQWFPGKGALVNTFRIIRRVLYTRVNQVYEGKPAFWYCPFLFADTTTRLANFCPRVYKDSSLREQEHSVQLVPGEDGESLDTVDVVYSGKKVFLREPYIVTGTWNLYTRFTTPESSITSWPDYLSSRAYVLDLAKVGRPMWAAPIEAENLLSFQPGNCSNEAVDSMLKYLHDLLVNKISALAIEELDPKSVDYQDELDRSLAICALSVGLERLNVESVRTELVQRYMAFLIDYNQRTGSTVISYPQEPLLSLLAAHVLRNNMSTVLWYVLQEDRINHLDVGNKGEFFARVLLLLSRLSLNPTVPHNWKELYEFSRPVSVFSFFEALIGTVEVQSIRAFLGAASEDDVQAAKEAIDVLEGAVVFSHFGSPLELSEDPIANITYALRHNSALYMGGNHQGSDIALPVILKDHRKGLILVEVKSLGEELTPTESQSTIGRIFKRMNSPDFLDEGIPTICIVLHVSRQSTCFVHKAMYSVAQDRLRRKKEGEVPIEEKRMLGIFINGISKNPVYPCLRDLPFSKEKTLLEEIESVIEVSRDTRISARHMRGGYPSGAVDQSNDLMNSDFQESSAAPLNISAKTMPSAKRDSKEVAPRYSDQIDKKSRTDRTEGP